MVYYDKDNIISIDELFSSIKDQCLVSDFLFRLDLLGILASTKNINIEISLKRIWSKIFPSIVLSSGLEQNCLKYFEYYRFGFKIMAKNEIIQKPMIILSTLIPVTILFLIEQRRNQEIDLIRLKRDVITTIEPIMNDESAIVNRTSEVVKQYFAECTVLSADTISLLVQYQSSINNVFEKLYKGLAASKTDLRKKIRTGDSFQEKRTRSTINCRDSEYNIPLKYIRIVCLMYLALEKHRKLGGNRESLLKEQWTKVFGSIPCTRQAQNEIDDFIASEPDLEALNKLFKYSLKEVRSGRIVRRIVVCLCVHQVLSRLPHNSSADMVIDEAMLLFGRFSALSVGREEADIEEYLKKFITDDGIVDERVSHFLWEYTDTISEFFKMSIENINSVDNARKRYWWEEELIRKEKEVNLLQNQIDATKTNTIFSLVEMLSSPTYNYVLSRLYRFTQGFDSLSTEETKQELKTLFHIFRLFGVNAVEEMIIDKELSDKACDGLEIITAVVPDMESGHIIFPGWDVDGDTVMLPIACLKAEEPV